LSSIPRAVAVVGPIAALSAASLTGTLLAPALLRRDPLVLMALSPRSVFLVAAAGRTSLPVFMAVGLIRLAAAAPSHFTIGQSWGRNLSAWLQRGPLPARTAGRVTEWLFGRLGPIALVVAPNGRTVALASASEVPAARVAAGVGLGLALRLTIFYVIAHHS
jgi:hypothetical protein